MCIFDALLTGRDAYVSERLSILKLSLVRRICVCCTNGRTMEQMHDTPLIVLPDVIYPVCVCVNFFINDGACYFK